jgi:hypothetical protein
VPVKRSSDRLVPARFYAKSVSEDGTCETGVFRRSGLCRMSHAVKAEGKIPDNLNWLTMRIRPQLRSALVIPHTSEATSAGVSLPDVPEGFRSSLLCRQRQSGDRRRQNTRPKLRDASAFVSKG